MRPFLLLLSMQLCIAFNIYSEVNYLVKGNNSHSPQENTILFGAQVFIEPGQTEAEIDKWFRQLKENGMGITRIRMFESYMHKPDGSWDFGLFDMAFRAAAKYGIKVYATIFPYTEKTDIGGFKFPHSNDHLQSIANYIKHVVSHFSKHQSMYCWVLINEPGVGGKIPDNEFTKEKFAEWRKTNPQKEFTEKGYPVLLDLSDQRFLLWYNTWFLEWIANEIKKHDTKHLIHVNNHAIFQNCAEYDFPAWRKFLDTQGGSAHAGWHFGYFKRDEYALAMAANCEIVRSGAGHLPWIMTEIQGGNNTYSAISPLCPTRHEIAQWMWTVLGTEGKGGIFWSLNPRASGIEAGEWAMLDFQDEPSDRLISAKEVNRTIAANMDLLAQAKEVDSGINLLYIRESLWAESKMAYPSSPPYAARVEGGVMKSLLGYFKAITELGINCNIKEFSEYDFNKNDFQGEVIILAHQIAIPVRYATILEHFVAKGGKLIVDGLTGFFDDDLHNVMKTGFPFAKLFGGNISEFKVVANLFDININGIQLPAHLWRGIIRNAGAEIVSIEEGNIYATRNSFDRGETLWIPSLIGLGAWLGQNQQLAGFLKEELHENMQNAPFVFAQQQKGLLMRTLKSGNSFITIIINKSGSPSELQLSGKMIGLNPEILFADNNGKIKGASINLGTEETIVIHWK